MKKNEKKSTNHQPSTQKPCFGAAPDHTFFAAEKGASTLFFQPKLVSLSAIQAKSATSEAEDMRQPVVQQMPAFESEVGANGEVQRTLFYSPQQSSTLPIQAKLTIGAPGDQYEQEADRVASQVVEQINAPVTTQSTQGQSVQRQEENKEELQAKSTLQHGEAIGRGEASTDLASAINSARRSGQPLDAGLQQPMGLALADKYSSQQQQPLQEKENKTDLPDNLKTGIENLSGYSMDDVKVNYHSEKPAQLNAHAFAQGTDIHLASGQEKHLPHEVWHVVQQKQGRVKPTMQTKEKVNVNDDESLEKEADVMGKKALQMKEKSKNIDSNAIAKTPSKKKERVKKEFGIMENLFETVTQGKYGEKSQERKDKGKRLDRGTTMQLMQDESTPFLYDSEDHQEGNQPGRFTRWYAKDKQGKLTERTLGFPLGWVKVGVNHKLFVYQSPQDKVIYEANKRFQQVEEGLAKTKQAAIDRIHRLIEMQDRLDKFVDQWVDEHITVKRLLIGLGLAGVTGVAAIYGLSLFVLDKWVYLTITGVSELVALCYAVRWKRNVLLPGLAKIGLLGFNSSYMLFALYKIAYDLFNGMPLNNFVWGALPFGLILEELIVYLTTLKNAKKEALKIELHLND